MRLYKYRKALKLKIKKNPKIETVIGREKRKIRKISTEREERAATSKLNKTFTSEKSTGN